MNELEITIRDCDLFAVTSKTATSADVLSKQLAEDRKIGVAWSVGNFEAGIGSSAAAVFDRFAIVAGAINVTGPDHHFTRDGGRRPEIKGVLLAASESISALAMSMTSLRTLSKPPTLPPLSWLEILT